ncbi:equilibrative nucleoside transporter family [Raphidocelis subcapitata]|uniref:Equilibrative nucleoside transporter family n=1 Tax=Raphidocelis subcapitata TaxID=307507 RepID=A0A2V0PG91_9CHLO|nr:equilibrative nucleoside transporter family [Raphidocelis subcapitata]|eukprot:GBF96920.1 equilibrative nucleoside transporter family [Raphidocelis subcapitata]
MSKHMAHQDRYGLVYGILVILGIGTLLPWNVMITEKEFFDVRLHVEPYLPAVAGNFMSLFGLTFNTFNLLGFCAVACLHSGRLSLRAQITYPLLVILALLASTAALALRLDLPGTVVAYYTLPTLAMLGVCMAVLQGGVLNLACLFPPIYIQGFVVGAGLSGVGTSVLSFMTQLRAKEADADLGGESRTAAQVAPAAFAYFSAAASVTALTALAFTLLGRLEFSRARLAAHYAAVRRAHHDEGEPLGESLLGTPYDEQTLEEGEPLPACERYWPAALIPYLHPATFAAEASMYWEADPADELAALEAGEDDGRDDDGAGRDGGSECGSGAWAEGSVSGRGSGSASASAPVAVPGGGRGSWAGAGSVPAVASSYDSGGGGGGGPESFRCGTALRFYRSSSASALKGMLEAALVNQQQQQPQQLGWQEGPASGGGMASPLPLQFQLGRRPSGSGSLLAPPTPGLEAAPALGPSAPARGGAGASGKPGAKARAGGAARPKRGTDARGTCPFITYAIAIVICMAGSLAVWPGVTAFICSVHNPAVVSPCAPRAAPYGRLAGDLFVPAMFVIYALGDVTGRIASSWGPWGRRPPAAASLLAYSLSRLGVVGALLLCHVVTPSPWQLPYMLRTDWWPLGLVLALGLTQGHLLSTACMHAPAVLPPGKEARFGPVTGFCITAGCLAGSIASTALVESFTRHDPLGWP